LLLIISVLGINSVPVEKESDGENDVMEIVLEDIGTDYAGVEGETAEKQIILKGVGKDTKALVNKKKPLFNKDFKVNDCKGGVCQEEDVDEQTLDEIGKCTYEGKLVDDPNSVVAITNCGGPMNLGLLSDKANLTSTSYRQSHGKVMKQEAHFLNDNILPKKDANELLAGSMEEKLKDGKVFVGKDNTYYEVEEQGSEGSDYSAGPDTICCFVKKTSCKIDRETKKLRCSSMTSKRICGEKCAGLQKTVATNAKKNIANIMKKNKFLKAVKKKMKAQPKKKKEETTKTPIKLRPTENSGETYEETTEEEDDNDTTEEDDDNDTTEEEDDNDTTEEEDDNETTEEEDDDETTDEEDDLGLFEDSDEDDDEYEDEEDEEDAGGETASNIRVKDVVLGELIKLQEETETYKLKGAQAHTQFRSNSVKMQCSYGLCRIKEPNPKEEIYKTRTIELGIFTDKYLWNKMKEQVEGADEDEEKVKKAMLEMIHSLFVITETFFLHPSLSAEGEYHLVLNGITLFKDDENPLVAAIHASRNTNDMLDNFKKYARKKNDLYDGNPNSYDMMILLSGAHENLGMPENSDMGLAFVNSVCGGEPVLMSTLNLRDGMHLDNAGALVAHEMGHMLGAHHDGGEDENKVKLDCPLKKFIMTPVQTGTITEWSTCSRKQFDDTYVARQTKNPEHGNCFFT